MRKDYPSLKEINKPSEADIKAGIRRYLELRGIFSWNQWQGQFSVPGVPDIIGILPGGKILGIEVKRPGWAPRVDNKRWKKQQAFIQRINDCGGVAFVATGIEDVIKGLQYRKEN
jgi:hypothetical protein